MALLEILSFKKKSPDILQKFKKCLNNVLSLSNIPLNLDIMYEYISYEQSKKEGVCTEYFLNNEIPSSLLLIDSNNFPITFLIKVISVLNKDNLKKFPFIPHSKLSLVYSERLVVYNLEADSVYIRYLTDNFYKDKYLRYATILLFSLKDALLKFHKSRLVKKIIYHFNECGDPEIFGMYMIYLLKERESGRAVYSLPDCKRIGNDVNIKSVDVNKINDVNVGNANIKSVVVNNVGNANVGNVVNKINTINDNTTYKYEDTIDFKHLPSTNKSPHPPLNLKNKPTSFYKAILSRNILEEITDTIIEEFTKIFQNTEEDLDFLKILIKEQPEALRRHLKRETGMKQQWSVIEVYNILSINKEEDNKEEEEGDNKEEEEEDTFLDKIINLQVKDKEVYYFILKVNKEAFFSRIRNINRLVGDEGFYSRVSEEISQNWIYLQ